LQRRLRLCGINTDHLDRTIRLYAKRFDGVFSSDRLPTKPRLLICNTDPFDESGKHWIDIYVDDDEHYGEYFDSLGRAPTRSFKRYINGHCRKWIYNCKRLQSIVSRFCGHYCACYCILRSKGVDMYRFLRYFTRSIRANDVILHELICNVYYSP